MHRRGRRGGGCRQALFLLNSRPELESLYAGLANALGGNNKFGQTEINTDVRRLSNRGDMHKCLVQIRYFTQTMYGLPGHRIARRSEIQNIATLSPLCGEQLKNRSAGGEGKQADNPAIGVGFSLWVRLGRWG